MTEKETKEELETSQNKKEEESSESPDDSVKTQDEGVDSTNNDGLSPEEIQEKNKQLFERAKKAETEKKQLEAKLLAYEKSKGSKEEGGSDDGKSKEYNVFDIAKTVSSLKDYSEKELEVIDRFSKSMGLTPTEAAQHEDVQDIIKARRDKVEKENSVPSPSNRSSVNEKSFEQWSPDDITDLIRDGSEESMKKIDEYRDWAKRN